MNATYETLTAEAYVCIGKLMPFMIGTTADGESLAVVRLGGHREAGETPWQCAVREALEEASLTITAITTLASFWLQSSNEPTEIVEQRWHGTEDDDVPPILVVADNRTTPGRRSVMYVARAESLPTPSHEAMGLLLLTADEVKKIVRGGMSLGAFLDAGGQALLRTPLSRDLVLEPFLQLSVLSQLLADFPKIRKAMAV
jgi:8-oxo-dGTP pyrophosphatase MutT (NUDIX family)